MQTFWVFFAVYGSRVQYLRVQVLALGCQAVRSFGAMPTTATSEDDGLLRPPCVTQKRQVLVRILLYLSAQ